MRFPSALSVCCALGHRNWAVWRLSEAFGSPLLQTLSASELRKGGGALHSSFKGCFVSAPALHYEEPPVIHPSGGEGAKLSGVHSSLRQMPNACREWFIALQAAMRGYQCLWGSEPELESRRRMLGILSIELAPVSPCKQQVTMQT